MRIDDRNFIRKIAGKDIQMEKLQSIFVVITILFTTVVLTVFTNAISAMMQMDNALYKEDAQIQFMYWDSSDNTKNAIMNTDQVKWVAERTVLGIVKQEDYKLRTIFADENTIKYHEHLQFTGTYSDELNQIIISKEYLEKLSVPEKEVGSNIILDLTGDGKLVEYKIAGIYTQGEITDKSRQYDVYINKATAVSLMRNKLWEIEGYIRLVEDDVDEQGCLAIAAGIAEQVGVDRNLVNVASNYPFGGRMHFLFTLMKKTGFVWGMLLLLAYLSVYSIFSVLVTGKVRTYGQFRTIGVTPKQLKRIIYTEQSLLSVRGIILGIIIGDGISIFINWKYIDIVNMLIIDGTILLCMWWITRLAVRVPVKMAMRVSPVECRRYIPKDFKGSKYRRHHRITPVFLGMRNLWKHKRKTLFITGSLFFCGFLTLLTSALMKSYSCEKMWRFHFFTQGEFQILISQNGRSSYEEDVDEWYSSRVQCNDNPMTERLLQNIKSINGVKSVSICNAVDIAVKRPDGWTAEGTQPILSKEQFIMMKDCFIGKAPTYDEFVNKNGILIAYDKDVPVAVGQECVVTVYGKDGEIVDVTVPIVGVFSQDKVLESCKFAPTPTYLMAEEVITGITGNPNTAYLYQVDTEPDLEEQVGNELQSLVIKNDNLELSSLREGELSEQESTTRMFGIILVMVIVIFVFSIEHFMNIALTDFHARKQEYGTLQAVGMTTGQVRNMIFTEITGYMMIPVILNVIIGSTVVYGICKLIDSRLHCIAFRYPVGISFGYIIAMILIQMLLINFLQKYLEKNSIVNQIRG